VRQVRNNICGSIFTLADDQPYFSFLGEYRLFPEEDAALLRTAAEQMLRALKDKVPAQMAEADQVNFREKLRRGGGEQVVRAVVERVDLRSLRNFVRHYTSSLFFA